MNATLTAEHLRRRALIYVRQSSAGQVLHNVESQRRQYALADQAHALGFQDVVVIDDDLGRSGSGLIERPGFQRLVADVCTGDVGAVFCIEASRLARNGRDWHHLIELCGMVGAVVIDPDGVYDPALVNDRLLLGLKGTISEFELNLLRQRSFDAIRQKAGRGELRLLLPVGLVWTTSGRIELDPDRRVQQALHLVFRKMAELGSARQVLLWCRQEQIALPARGQEAGTTLVWKLPVYETIRRILTNPMYAGAYAFGKTERRTKIVDGRARKTEGHRKPRSAWTILLRDHHPAYISWDQYEGTQATLAMNTHMKSRMLRKAGRGGRALLAGLLRCRRCGRMLRVAYAGRGGTMPRYYCMGAHHRGERRCIAVGGLKVDHAVAHTVLQAIAGNAIEAAVEAADQLRRQRQEQRQTLVLEGEQATYEARLAARRYEAVDPENRLVAAELEARWNEALQKVRTLAEQLDAFDHDTPTVPIPDRALLVSLAHDLPAVWYAPATDMRLKQRIVRILLQEVVADIDEGRGEIVLLLHWAGGRHSERRVKKNASGQHGRCTTLEAIEVVRQMAGTVADDQIAATLNRLRLRTGAGNAWNATRVQSVRAYHALPAFDPHQPRDGQVTLEQAARRLGISPTSVRRLIRNQQLPARQVVSCAPWEIPSDALDSEVVRQAVDALKQRTSVPRTHAAHAHDSMFSER